MKAKLLLLNCFIISQLVLGMVECKPAIKEKINQWYMAVQSPTTFHQIPKLFQNYEDLFDMVENMKDKQEKLICEVHLEFSSYWFLMKAVAAGNQEVINSLILMRETLTDKLEKGIDTKLKISKDETAFTDYYTAEKRNEISKLLQENMPNFKKAAKLGFELVFTANMQFDFNESKINLADLKSASEYINKIKKKFPQSSDLFDALSFYLCVLYSNFIFYQDEIEIPNEFKDPITSKLMEYPVKLPDNYILDRKTIARFENMNPFNNKILTEDDLVHQKDLGNRITEWKVKTLASHKIERKNSLECVLLD